MTRTGLRTATDGIHPQLGRQPVYEMQVFAGQFRGIRRWSGVYCHVVIFLRDEKWIRSRGETGWVASLPKRTPLTMDLVKARSKVKKRHVG